LQYTATNINLISKVACAIIAKFLSYYIQFLNLTISNRIQMFHNETTNSVFDFELFVISFNF